VAILVAVRRGLLRRRDHGRRAGVREQPPSRRAVGDPAVDRVADARRRRRRDGATVAVGEDAVRVANIAVGVVLWQVFALLQKRPDRLYQLRTNDVDDAYDSVLNAGIVTAIAGTVCNVVIVFAVGRIVGED
jgi:hypothetical protein